ncbi:MAG: hypothetical protein DRP01_01055 [Archaeoglobales archaeon]|nr:MAG: hypothetical protein DRP01_01055 [Archaeoglobales archaeon]
MKMPRPKKEEPMSLTTVYIPTKALEWIRTNSRSIAGFIREAVVEKIEREQSYQAQIEKLEKEIQELNDRIKFKRMKLEELRKKKEEYERQQRLMELRERIATAIVNIHYTDYLECARDLRELGRDMEWEEWRDLVKSVWDEVRINGF